MLVEKATCLNISLNSQQYFKIEGKAVKSFSKWIVEQLEWQKDISSLDEHGF